MLLEFSISNFRSIKDRQTLSMLPSRRVKERPNPLLFAEQYKGVAAISSSIIYGGNNAGKSNILKGIQALKWLVQNSGRLNLGDNIEANEYFALDLATVKQPTVFEIDFIAADGLRYDYFVSFNKAAILKEALYYYPITKSGKLTRAKLYVRSQNTPISFGDDLTGEKKTIERQLNPNQLFLSKAANNNQTRLAPVYLFFKQQLGVWVFHDTDYENNLLRTLGQFLGANKDTTLTRMVEFFLSQADTGVLGFEVHENQVDKFSFPQNVPPEIKQQIIRDFRYEIKTRHRMYENGKPTGQTTLHLENQSTGTNKLLALLSLILQALTAGDVLLIDELDKSLHPHLTKLLIELFHHPNTNPNHAQLIFATHDATLLESKLFAKDQFYFVEKDKLEATQLYNLSDIQGVRKNVPLEKWYLSGRFGGIPTLPKRKIYDRVADFAKVGVNG